MAAPVNQEQMSSWLKVNPQTTRIEITMDRDKTILADMGSGRRCVAARAKQVPEKENRAMGEEMLGDVTSQSKNT